MLLNVKTKKLEKGITTLKDQRTLKEISKWVNNIKILPTRSITYMGWCNMSLTTKGSAFVYQCLTLFDMRGHDAPQMFLTTVLKRLGGGNWHLVTFMECYFWLPRLSDVTMATSLSGSTRDFLKLSFHMFPYNEILKVFKSKIWYLTYLKQAPRNTSKYQISVKSVKGFGSYDHMNFRPMCWLKYRLRRYN